MRCPHCAGEIPAGSRFCGICGRGITPAVGGPEVAVEGGRWPPGVSPFAPSVESQADSMSLFEMPASRAARRARTALVLVLDAILAGAGVVMLMAYFDGRGEARSVGRPGGTPEEPTARGQGGVSDPGSDGAAEGAQPGAASPPDGGSSLDPPDDDVDGVPARAPGPARRTRPPSKQKVRPARKSPPAIPDDGSRVDT